MTRRTGQRARSRRRPAAGATVPQLPFQQLRNPYPPVEIISADELESIHEASLELLQNVDTKSGSPAFGTPEYVKATLIGGQLARRYSVPYRSSNVNASNAPDVQAAYESQMSI